MPGFYFRITERDEIVSTDQAFDFNSADAACLHARTVLTEMALDGLPHEPFNMYCVEVLDSRYRPIYKIQLKVEASDGHGTFF